MAVVREDHSREAPAIGDPAPAARPMPRLDRSTCRQDGRLLSDHPVRRTARSRASVPTPAYYRRIAYRIGKPKAITATARKLAILVYRTLKGDLDYSDPGAQAYEEHHRERTLRNVRNRAKTLGFGLVSLETGELLQGSVS